MSHVESPSESDVTCNAAAVLAALVANPNAPRLTPSEQEVLMLLLDSFSNAQIATRRGRALRTVANQVTAVLRKFHVTSRAELASIVAGIVRGEAWFTEAQRGAPTAASVLMRLKPRQRQAMTLRARGYSLKCIGYELGVATSTASIYLKVAMRALKIRSCLELCARFGVENAERATLG